MLTAEQKIRYALTGNPDTTPEFRHEGDNVIHRITGGTLPDIYVTLQRTGEKITVRCAGCSAELGTFPADYGGDTSALLGAMRTKEHEHHQR